MFRFAPSFRRPALGLASLCSFCVGAGALWVWATPENVRSLSTAHLLGVLALMGMPALAAVAVAADRRIRRARVAASRPDRGQAPSALAALVEAHDLAAARSAEPPRTVVHGDAAEARRLSSTPGRARSSRQRSPGSPGR